MLIPYPCVIDSRTLIWLRRPYHYCSLLGFTDISPFLLGINKVWWRLYLVHPASVQLYFTKSWSPFPRYDRCRLCWGPGSLSESSLFWCVCVPFDCFTYVSFIYCFCHLYCYIDIIYCIGSIMSWFWIVTLIEKLVGKILYPSLEWKHKIGWWLNSTDSLGEYLVRVGMRTSLRVDPFENVVARLVFIVRFDVSKGSVTLRTF